MPRKQESSFTLGGIELVDHLTGESEEVYDERGRNIMSYGKKNKKGYGGGSWLDVCGFSGKVRDC